jgi:3-hydroxyisobutyrate dehydrogenase
MFSVASGLFPALTLAVRSIRLPYLWEGANACARLESVMMMSDRNSDGLRAGVIGLGAIGGGVAVSLARNKRPLAVYDVRPDAAATLDGVPAVERSPAAVSATADVVMIAVVNAEQVRATLEGPDGLLAGVHPGLVLVLLSTVSLNDLRGLAAIANAAGVPLLDCGVTGGPASAPKGELIAMIGGEDRVVERVRPVLEDWSEFVQHMGLAGSGMAAKIARNIIHYQIWRAGHEGAALASRSGVDLAKFVAVVQRAATKPGASPTVWMTEESVSPPGAWPEDQLRLRQHILGLMKKDLEAALSLARAAGLELPSTEAAYRGGAEIFGL